MARTKATARGPHPATAGLMVLGMHRSGTSALARVLDLCGADIGARILGESAGNEAGHWEDALAVEIHEQLLAAYGARWDTPLCLPADWLAGEPARVAARRVGDYVGGERADHALWAVKDPRLCLFAPLWTQAAQAKRQDIGAVLVLRHPLEVAASLAVRDGIAEGRSLLLWLEYTLAAVAAIEELPHVVIGYDTLIEDWRACVARLRRLPGGERLDADRDAAAIDAFLDRGMRHHRAPPDRLLPALVAETWRTLSACLRTGRIPDGTARRLQASVAPARELLRPVMEESRVSEQRLWERIGRAEAGLGEAVAATGSVPTELEALRDALERHRTALIEAFSGEVVRMQGITAEAMQAAAQREGEAELARQVAPRLQAMEGELLPLAQRMPAELAALVESVDTHRAALVEAVSGELRRMQDVTAEAMQAAAQREGEAELARQVAPRLQAMEGELLPLAQRMPAELAALVESVDAHRAALVEAISGELRRMQDVTAEAMQAAAQREGEAGLARQVAPRLQALVESVDAHRAALVEAISGELRRMQDATTEAIQAAAQREGEAELARQVAPRLQAMEESVDKHRAALVEAISGELRRMQDVTAEAVRQAATDRAAAESARREAERAEAGRQRMEEEARLAQGRAALLQGEVRMAQGRIAMLQGDATVAQGRIAALQDETVAAQARIAVLQDEIAAMQASLAEANAGQARMAAELEVADVRFRDLSCEAVQLREQAALLEQIRRSRSWRWTRPVRVALRLLGDPSGPDARELRRRLRALRARLPFAGTPSAFDAPGAGAGAGALPPPATVSLAPAEEGLPDVFVWAVIDWHFRTQRPQHLARALASRGHRVFYVSNNFVDSAQPGFRADPLDDSGRLFQVHLNLAGAPPIYFGLPDAAQADAILGSLAELLRWSNTDASTSLVQHPYWSPFVRAVPNARVVYDCMDHHAGFENNAPAVIRAEQDLLADADLVIVTSAWLEREVAPRARATALVRNAGDAGFFAEAPEKVFRDPDGRQVIGYFGAIAEWFDVGLVREIALANPGRLVLLIGSDTVGAAEALSDLPNVRFEGEVPYASLPYWLHGFDVALLPFRVIDLTMATNPVKVYEYLAAGKPVVAVDVPEMAQFGGLVRIGRDHDGFVAAVADALEAPEAADAADARRRFAEGQTWSHRALELDGALASIDEPLVTVVVLTYNNLDFSRSCLFSVEHYSDYANLEVIVVDNASTDGSADWLRAWEAEPSRAGHRRRLILNDANLGFAAGNNVGLRAASGEYLVMLNNDTYVTRGWVRTLCAHLRRDPSLGLVGPVTNNIGNEAKLEIAYGDIVEMHRVAGEYTRSHPGREIALRTAAFFCVAMPRRVFERVGELDEAFGLGFFEDDDYCRRVELAGWRIACADDVFVHHHLSASFDQLKAEAKKKLFDANKAIYEAKWGAWEPHAYRSPA